MRERINPEAFAPGEYIREELEARGWTQLDLAEILGWHAPELSNIITSKTSITPATAVALASAFGTSAQLWLNLDSAYKLSKISPHQDSTVTSKAELYKFAPVKEMQLRGWIKGSNNVETLRTQILTFYGIERLDQQINFCHASRKSTDYGSVTSAQSAWFCRARQLAYAVPVTGKFSEQSFQEAMERLSKLKAELEEARHISHVLSDAGIRFLIVEHLAQTKIDGVCFWLDPASPVVAVSLRYDRIDWFWHTVMHEMCHVKNRDGMQELPTLDTELVGSDAQPFEGKPENEKRADSCAVNFLVDQEQLNRFIARVHPLYSSVKIMGFARRMGVHPGIVVGQLQHRNKVGWSHHRGLLDKVKNIVTASTLTDGWGQVIQV